MTAFMRCNRKRLNNKEAKMTTCDKAREEVIRLNQEREAKIKRRMAGKTQKSRIEQK